MAEDSWNTDITQSTTRVSTMNANSDGHRGTSLDKTGGLICTESSKCSYKDNNGSICYFEYILQFKEIYFWFIEYQ